ncbi:MAG: ATP-binding cassette domain-containing protein [Gammaproteobacteria bacterium]|nr:ATP-binding cassette domain-containing protein [Gammaproteobacteria bacterium]
MRDRWIAASVLSDYPLVEVDPVGMHELDDPDAVWYVESGCVDVFSVGIRDGVVATAYEHVLRAGEDDLIFGVAMSEDTPLRLRAKTSAGLVARRIPVADLFDGRFGDALADRIDAWIEGFTEAIVEEIVGPPVPDAWLEADAGITLTPGSTVTSRRGVVWIPASENNLFVSTISTARGAVPLTPASWAQCNGNPPVRQVSTTAALLAEARCDAGLAEFHRVALAAIRENRALVVADLAILQMERTALRREQETAAHEALDALASGKARREAPDTELLAALRAIGAHERTRFQAPAGSAPETGPAALADLLRAADVRTRAVRLPDNEEWWRGDNGAMLGYLGDDRAPVALIPSGTTGRYRILDPRTGRAKRMTRQLATMLAPRAVAFYPPLPPRPVEAGDVVRMVGAGAVPHLLKYAALGVMVALIAYVPVLALGLVVSHITPTGDRGALLAVIVGVVALGFIGSLLQLMQSFTLIRLEGRGATRITAAFWSRVLRLPSRILRGYRAGDLAAQVLSFQQLRDVISGAVTNAVTSLLFMLPAACLLIVFDPALTVALLAVGLVALLASVLLGAAQLPYRQRVLETAWQLNGKLYEFINAIGRVQKARAMEAVFAAWAMPYQAQKRAEQRANELDSLTRAVNGAAPLIASTALLAMFALSATPDDSVGDFLVVYLAGTVFFSALTRLGAVVSALTEALSTYRQAAPLLSQAPESSAGKQTLSTATPRLGGDLRLDHATFRYDQNGPLILDDVSIRCHPGEFVAIVGESGSGKSTILRLLLGLEKPDSGAAYYDGSNLSGFDLEVFRQRIGVVTQDAALVSGTILENIVGVDSSLTEDDAWTAAELASVADDIRDMPMGMNTAIGGDVALLSGGQAQRLLIAAALVRKPKLLLLDEATNSLDNTAQASIVANIDRALTSRIVIAHRLTTIRGADRIYVMSAGKVVQEGSFDELAAVPGEFRDLVERQTT